MPKGAIYVGRPTKWGNPFFVGGWFAVHIGAFKYLQAREGYQDSRFTKIETVEQAIDFYRRCPPNNCEELRGKDLSCWCALDKPCHADVLLQIANGVPQ